MSDTESMSERELAEWFTDEAALGTQPRSVGEALAAADEQAATATEVDEAPPVLDDEQPVVVEDEPVDTPADTPDAELPVAPVVEPEAEDIGDEDEDDNVVWAKKKYGDDPTKWAAAARAQEQHISRLAGEKKEAEELAGQWYEYSQQIEQQAAQQQQMSMPLSSAEEQWIENSLANPYAAARQAAMQGSFNLYQGVIARVAEENPMLAAQIGAQVQTEMQDIAMQEQNGAPQPTLQQTLGQSIQRLGIDLDTYGEPMSAKIGELGEHHPYVQTILEGDPNAREIALMAVYDLVRSNAMSTRKVRSTEREEQIKQEAELRRQAAGVVTGGPTPTPQKEKSPLMAAMEEEWRQRGQWTSDE